MKRWFRRREVGLGAALFVLLLAVYGGLYLLWLSGHQSVYLALTRAWGIDTWSWPFLDLNGVLSWAECHRHGIDVLRSDPCDVLGRRLNYGPPLIYLPFGLRDTTRLGLTQSLLFLAALPFVLRPRTWREWAVAAAACLSTVTLFALERGNLDLSEFVLVAGAVALAGRGTGGRLASYALYYTGGTIKFYPFALFLTVLRERPRRALALGVAAVVLVFFCFAVYWRSLATIRALLPGFTYGADMFGASFLGNGLANKIAFSASIAHAVTAALYAVFGIFAFRLASAWLRREAPPDFATANGRTLLAGAIVMTGCFVLQANVEYRAIFLLFMLPGLHDLGAQAPSPRLRRVFRLAVASLLFCLWGELFRHGLEYRLDAMAPGRGTLSPASFVSYAFFVCWQLVWWWLMAVSLAIVLMFVRTSPLGAMLRARPAA